MTDAFVDEAAATGIDIFRIFDALNDVGQMRPAIDAVRDTGTAVAEVALCYTGDLSDPAERLYTLDYYLRLAEQIVDAGAHVLAIKDMAGLLRPPAARDAGHGAARAVRPARAPAHPRHRRRPARHAARRDRRGRGRRGRRRRVDGRHHQPAVAVRARRRHRPHRRGPPAWTCRRSRDLEPYWEAVRKVYAPFESGLASPTGRVYTHEIPGGQLSNLRQQAIALGLGDRFELIEDYYAAADRMLGRLVKVTPSSKVVGDLALHLVGAGVEAEDFEADPGEYDMPDSVIGFLRGELGDPPGGWPEPFRTQALAGPRRAEGRHAADRRRPRGPDADTAPHPADHAEPAAVPRTDPGVRRAPRRPTATCRCSRPRTSSTACERDAEHAVELEPGVTLLIGLEAISEPDDRGMRTVRHHPQRPAAAGDGPRPQRRRSRRKAAEKADRGDPGHVAAPFAGVVTLAVARATTVEPGQTVATIEAMKMEASITAPRAGP